MPVTRIMPYICSTTDSVTLFQFKTRKNITYYKKYYITEGEKCKLNCISCSVVCRGPQVWNEIENSRKRSLSASALKKSLKHQLLQRYAKARIPETSGDF